MVRPVELKSPEALEVEVSTGELIAIVGRVLDHDFKLDSIVR